MHISPGVLVRTDWPRSFLQSAQDKCIDPHLALYLPDSVVDTDQRLFFRSLAWRSYDVSACPDICAAGAWWPKLPPSSIIPLYSAFVSYTANAADVGPTFCVALGIRAATVHHLRQYPPPRHRPPPTMSPAGLLFDSLEFTLHGLGISCIVGGVGYATDSQLTYCHIAEWVERLCRGDGDAVLVTLLCLSTAFSWVFPPMIMN